VLAQEEPRTSTAEVRATPFSKKVENHAYFVALYTMHYNFCRIHQTLRVTPAMEAGLTDHVWTIEEMLSKIGL
jgi:hypothetical protein